MLSRFSKLFIILSVLCLWITQVHAQSVPVIDNFDAGINDAWVTLVNATAFTPTSGASCVVAGCAEDGAMRLPVTMSDNGFLSIYLKTTNSSPGTNGASLFISTSATTTNPGAVAGLGFSSQGIVDSAYHQFNLYWNEDSTTGHIMSCTLIDTTDTSACGPISTWFDTGFVIGTTFQYIYLYLPKLSGDTFADEIYGSTNTQNQTQFLSFIPPPESVASSSLVFNIGLTGYLSSSDFAAGTAITLAWRQITHNGETFVGLNSGAETGSVIFGVNGPGDYSLSTTTPIQSDGVYEAIVTITKPVLNIFGFDPSFGFANTQIAQNIWNFTVGTSTPSERALARQAIFSVGSQVGSTTVQDTSSCNFLSGFNLSDCMIVLLRPDPQTLSTDFQQLHDQVLTHVPWGYATRFLGILGEATTTSLPAWSATFVYGPPENLATDTISYDPGDMLAGGATIMSNIRDPNSGKNLRDITEPWLFLFLGITLIIIIFHDIMSMGHHTKGSQRH